MTICRVLEVFVSGYYAWCKWRPSQHSPEEAQIAQEIQAAFEANRQVYGSPRIHAELQAHGRRGGRKRIARLMQELHLCAQLPRHRTVTTQSEQGARVADNVLQQDFQADSPNRKWISVIFCAKISSPNAEKP